MSVEDDPRSQIANAITPIDAIPAHDEGGGTVASLTEAVMGVTAAGFAIASAIDNLARSYNIEKERSLKNGESEEDQKGTEIDQGAA